MTDQQRQLPDAASARPVQFDRAPEPGAATIAALDEELRALPALAPPPHLWQDIRARTAAMSDRVGAGRPRNSRFAPLALAASVFATAAIAVFVVLSPADRGAEKFDMTALLERSRAVEAERRSMPALFAPSNVERVLRVRIGGLDASFNEQLLRGADPEARQALLLERIELMEDLKNLERYRHSELVRQAVF